MERFKKTPEEGCLSMLYCATTTKQSGQYVCPPAVVEEGSALSQDAALGEQVRILIQYTIVFTDKHTNS